MTDGSLPDRLTQLRTRWEADPASRVFLQLAEEYRHQGRLHEALGVLDEGLREHPGYLSALVAKGRCLLELGQPAAAREVLERVVRQDATQMVANKLLVRTYLDTGQAALARERLDLYNLLHDGDPEVEELRSRIERLEAASAASAASGDGASRPPAAEHRGVLATMANLASNPAEDDIFDLGAPVAATSRREGQDVFDLSHVYVGPAPAGSVPASTPMAPPTPVATGAPPAAPIPAPPDDDEPEPVAPDEPFAGLLSRAVRRRYHEGIVAEGIFAFELPSEWAAAAMPAPVPETVAADLAPAPVALPIPEPWPSETLFELTDEPPAAATAPVPAFAAEPEPVFDLAPPAPAAMATAPAPMPEPPAVAAGERPAVATATLGDLYLRQGHASEAERIFDEVLEREPGNAAAQDGLARLRALREPAAAAEPFAEPAAAPSAVTAAIPLDRKAKRVRLLNSYLDRIRRGSGRHVS
jgi:tetratricopeptide (TPR) repeat protein